MIRSDHIGFNQIRYNKKKQINNWKINGYNKKNKYINKYQMN